MEVYGIIPQRKVWVKIAAVILGIFATYYAYKQGDWFYVPFGLMIIFATFSKRQHVISYKGVDIEYRILGRCFHNLWTYNEIMAVHTNSYSSLPNIEIHISKGVINRRFIFSPKDAKEVIKIIKEAKPEIIIKEINYKRK